ncbi:MAG TPA: hypothetical protein ACQGQX_05325, partial [Xylella taiwanensis]
MHIYGIPGIAALIVSLWPAFMRRILPWLSIRKGKQKQAIQKALDEIETFASKPFDPVPFAT